MGYLIEVDAKALERGVSFGEVTGALDAAFVSLAEQYVKSVSAHRESVLTSTLEGIRGSLPRVLSPASSPSSPLIYPASTGDWELSEVHRQLCQVGVLAQALALLEQVHPNGVINDLSPTQQKGHDAVGTDGERGAWCYRAA